MGVISDAAESPGDLMKRLARLERKVAALSTARRSEATAIGKGGLRIKGGRILIQDPAGTTTMTLSTDGLSLEGLLAVLGEIDVSGGGSVVVRDGGGVLVDDGGDITARGGRFLAEEPDGTDVFRVSTDPAEIFLREDLIEDLAVGILANRLQTDVVTGAGQTSVATPNWADLTEPGTGDPSLGPEVATTVGPAGRMIISLSARFSVEIGNANLASASMSADVIGPEGAVPTWPSQASAVIWSSTQNFMAASFGRTFVLTGLTPGNYSIAAKYQASDTDDVAQFGNRSLWVLAF